jgi:hypothetical protein
LRRSGQGSGRLRSPLAPSASVVGSSRNGGGRSEITAPLPHVPRPVPLWGYGRRCRGRTRAWSGRPTSVGQQRSRHLLRLPGRRHRWRTMRARWPGQRGWTGLPSGSRRALLLYLLARRFARPFAVRPLPRARAAFPLAPVERLPVNFENASSIRPADLSTKPSALSRRPDFIAPPFPPRAWKLTHLFPRDDRTNQYGV